MKHKHSHTAPDQRKIYIRFFGALVLITFVLLMYSCSNTKFLDEDETLYTYTWFTEKGFGKINDKPFKAYQIQSTAIVKTNRAFVGLPRTNLLIYNYMKPRRSWGLKHWFYNFAGRPPVLLEQVNPEFRLKVMKQQLFDMGHFDSNIELDLKIYGKNHKKARAIYRLYFKPSYTFRNIHHVWRPTGIDSLISKALPKSLIHTGEDYWVSTLEKERIRLSRTLRNHGYYFFQPDYIMFHADTSAGNRQVDLSMVVKDDIPEKVYATYNVRNVSVHVRSNRSKQAKYLASDTIIRNNISYSQDEAYYRPEVITDVISIQPGELYSFTDQDNTSRYLQGMLAFRSVSVNYTETDTLQHLLDAHIELIPQKPIQLNAEVNFATKSNDFLGPAASVSMSHMNVFRGAEQLSLQIDGGFEWQKRSKRKEYELGVNSFEVGTQLKLVVPRFLVPFSLKKQSSRYVPKTRASVGFRSQRRVKYYTMNLSQMKFGYNWRTSSHHEFRADPFSIDYLRLTEKSDEFDEYLQLYPQVAISFEEQLIPGGLFGYTYSSNPARRPYNTFYYNGTLDLAGNIVGAVYGLAGLGNSNPDELLGAPFAQFTRITNDFRYYFYFNEKKQLATRLFSGIGVPYGNSEVLPYSKQFFAGGSQDIRAFYARTIGPGSYQPADSLGDQVFLDQSGDIKLLASLEYRFPITYMVNGALFVDAGNIWLLNADESRPGGQFAFDRFYKEIAIGAGFGLRVDLDFLIIRLDAAIPIRKPYIPSSEKWIFNDPSFVKDFILSLAVGYPF